jgi:POLQ-like helicase
MLKSTNLEWQRDLLAIPALVDRRQNYVLSLPTGSGKTLVAEVLMLREALVRRRNSLLILPYVAIVQEKVAFRQFVLPNLFFEQVLI